MSKLSRLGIVIFVFLLASCAGKRAFYEKKPSRIIVEDRINGAFGQIRSFYYALEVLDGDPIEVVSMTVNEEPVQIIEAQVKLIDKQKIMLKVIYLGRYPEEGNLVLTYKGPIMGKDMVLDH